jgi:outer membrane protein, heavy metal efflux system
VFTHDAQWTFGPRVRVVDDRTRSAAKNWCDKVNDPQMYAHTIRFAGWHLLFGLLGGCAGRPDFPAADGRVLAPPSEMTTASSVAGVRTDSGTFELPASIVRLDDVLRYASSHRQEIRAARARARAAGERPAIVSALEDPMIMPSVDHAPYMVWGEQADLSLMVEQSFPFSGIRGHRRRVAEAEARRLGAESERVVQDILLDAARSFLMLRERRDMARVLDEQLALARQLVMAANARYSAGTGSQPDVLRAEIEVARLEGSIRSIRAEITAAENMFNTSLGRPADAPVPELEGSALMRDPQGWGELRETTLRQRSELDAGRAEISRAESEISVMRSMYSPMGIVRTGPAYTMADKGGWMLGVGVSLPIWRSRLRAGVREAQEMAEMARADLAAMTRMIEGEAATTRSQVLATRERVLALREDVLPRARQAIEPSVSAYASGNLPLTSIIDTAQALWSLQAEYVSAEYELGLAWARLYRAQGRFVTGGTTP